jgi:hypothetical protein
MSSGLINRYAQVSKKPLLEVEKEWRTIKREHRESGRKKDYDSCIKTLRERLGLKLSEGREAYLRGDALVEILAETPEFALIQVEDIGSVEDPGLKKLLFASKGIMTVPFEHLTNGPGGEPLTEVTTGLSAPAYPQTAPATSLTPPRPVSPGTNTTTQDPLMGIVLVQGKKAVIVSRTGNQARVRFLDTKEEANVNVTELKPDTTLESLAAVWRSLVPELSEKRKRRIFAAILKLEHSIAYLPKRLQEELENLGPYSGAAGNQTAAPPAFPFKKPEDDSPAVDEEEAEKREDFEFGPEDWRLIFDLRRRKEEEERETEERNPMPEPPEEGPAEPGQGIGAREGEPASKNIRPASEKEVHDMLGHMRTARESYEAARGRFSDRPKLSSLLAEAERGLPEEAPKSIMEKNLDRAASWSELIDE